MGSPLNIDTIVDRGALHVSVNGGYAGKISSFNNFFTKSFAKLFRLSIDKKIGDKVYCLSKKSYKKHLEKSTGVDDIESKKDYEGVWSDHSSKIKDLTDTIWPHLS